MLIEDSYWTSIGRGPTTPLRYDGDGIHVDGAASKQTIRRSYVVDIGDDAIDHSNSTFTLEDTVIHDAGDKAISMTNGLATIRNSLIYRTGSGGARHGAGLTAPSPRPRRLRRRRCCSTASSGRTASQAAPVMSPQLAARQRIGP